MNDTHQTEVLIVGAGPTGLSLAAQLQRFGIDYILCDQKEGITDLSKALVVHARTLEIYEQLGLADAAVEAGSEVSEWALMHHGKVAAQLNLENLGEGQSPFPFVLIYEQSKNEALLYEHLQKQEREVLWKHELLSLKETAQGVSATLNSETGEKVIQANYVVGCDGASSKVRHLLDFPFSGSTHPRMFFVADVKMHIDLSPETVCIAFNEDAFLLMAPMAGAHHWRLVGNLSHTDQEPDFESLLPHLQSVIQKPFEIEACEWYSSYKVHTRHAEHFMKGHCFLAGDAAHVHTPAGGQGMNTGIQDAYNLAWKLWLMLRHQGKQALLESYDSERLSNAQRLLKSTDRAFDMMTTEQSLIRAFREQLLPSLVNLLSRFVAVREIVFPMLSQTGIHYHDSPLSVAGELKFNGVKAGDRLPWFEIQGQSIYQELKQPCFHLLVFEDGRTDTVNLVTQAQAGYADLMDVVKVPLYPFLTGHWGNKACYVLLRPDMHLALAAPIEDGLRAVESYFARWLKR